MRHHRYGCGFHARPQQSPSWVQSFGSRPCCTLSNWNPAVRFASVGKSRSSSSGFRQNTSSSYPFHYIEFYIHVKHRHDRLIFDIREVLIKSGSMRLQWEMNEFKAKIARHSTAMAQFFNKASQLQNSESMGSGLPPFHCNRSERSRWLTGNSPAGNASRQAIPALRRLALEQPLPSAAPWSDLSGSILKRDLWVKGRACQ